MTVEADDIATPEVETPEQVEQQETPEPEDSVVVTFGDETPPEEDDDTKGPAPEWVREVRKANRELAKENRALKAKMEAAQQPQVEDLGKEPDLEDFDYDTAKFKQAFVEWTAKKSKHDAAAAARKTEAEKAQAEWVATQESYNKAKESMKSEDFDDAEAVVMGIFSPTQQGIALMAASSPAQLVLGLGLNPDKAKELAAIKDPVKFTAALVRLEAQMKVTTRKAPAPERAISGTAPKSGAVDSKLKQLEEEADRTGDRSKVIAYKRANKK